MRTDRHAVILSTVISFRYVSGTPLAAILSSAHLFVSVAEDVKKVNNRYKKAQSRGLVLTGRLWFGPAGCSKSFTSSVRFTGCHVCYCVARDMQTLGKLISTFTSQLPPSKSASNSLISSVSELIDLLKIFQLAPPMCGQQNHPSCYPSLFSLVSDVNEGGRSVPACTFDLCRSTSGPSPI